MLCYGKRPCRYYLILNNRGLKYKKVVVSCVGFLAEDIAMYCNDRGKLFCNIWNIYTKLINSKLKYIENENKELNIKCRDLNGQIKR